jgi:hypothetical protein
MKLIDSPSDREVYLDLSKYEAEFADNSILSWVIQAYRTKGGYVTLGEFYSMLNEKGLDAMRSLYFLTDIKTEDDPAGEIKRKAQEAVLFLTAVILTIGGDSSFTIRQLYEVKDNISGYLVTEIKARKELSHNALSTLRLSYDVWNLDFKTLARKYISLQHNIKK